MQNISLGHLVHEAADRMMVDEEDRKFMTNVTKRGALVCVSYVQSTYVHAFAATYIRTYELHPSLSHAVDQLDHVYESAHGLLDAGAFSLRAWVLHAVQSSYPS